MCDHSDDKHCTYMEIFDKIAEVYMCECGALIDVNSERGLKDNSMTPGELTMLVQELLNEKVNAIKTAVMSAIEGA